ncbi:ABC-2 transporter permease [Clostridium oryzae]|uniref:ABC-2 family transporter protein n=1 Tax=Clostridium oryzae TaxID=1450648 RepID=A0A1V4IW62_9CLOT|nr:ABC-2 transporter permease [Clostridium oryzae]OPJ64133.1 hypothetical protein CLORY_06800 [Clostridium oryzae]
MLKLVLKDLLIQKAPMKNPVTNIAANILFVVVAQFFSAACAYIVTPFIFTYSLLVYSCGFGEKNEVDVMLNSLPVARKEVVYSKYISGALFFIIGLVFTTVVCTLIKMTGLSNMKSYIKIQYIILGIIFSAVYCSVYIPMYLWRGNTKSQPANNILTIVIFLSIVVVVLITTFIDNGTAKSSIMELAASQRFKFWGTAVSLVSSILMICISLIISLKVYVNRDL